MELVVLDQNPIYWTNSTGQDTSIAAVQESVRLARDCEALGWDRYWIAEHHDRTSGCGSPEILVSAIGAQTSRIRIGTAAVLLPHYTPLKVATTFNLLERMYPGRIDLGIGRGPGGSPAAISRLASVSVQSYGGKIAELLGYFHTDRDSVAELESFPKSSVPQIFVNGSSAGGATAAAEYGLPFVFAQFAHKHPQPEFIEQYRNSYHPGPGGRDPVVGLGMLITCIEDPEEAAHQRALLHWMNEARQNAGVIPDRDEARNLTGLPADDNLQNLVGTPAEIEPRLAELLNMYRPDLLAVSTQCPDYALRLRSYELVRDLVADLTRSPEPRNRLFAGRAGFESATDGEGIVSHAGASVSGCRARRQ
ncbi:MsnO8 family LLM class oxidoreductase [Nocardia sp. NPDC019395]|uniref:MsnO8 family LLM class oxidoreductase n=1 Tax=Nocardia sp. NPDC019395 TaxID=3154686 RepID=UPI0033EC3036